MKILVDADACPVRKVVIRVAKEFNLKVIMFYDESHVIDDGYSENVIVEIGKDSVDITLTQYLEENDIVITQDFGLAQLCLNKKAKVLNQNGMIFNEYNIDYLIMSRDTSAKKRFYGHHSSGPKKRKNKDDQIFEKSLRMIIKG